MLTQFPQRKTSAIRTFPAGCGRNAPSISTEEYLKHVSSEKGNHAGEKVQDGYANGTFPAGCGRNAPSISKEYLKHVSSEKGNHAGEKVHDGYACSHSLMDPRRQRKQGIGKSISGPTEKKQKTENWEGVPTKKKVPPRGKVAFLDPDEIIAKHKVDKEDKYLINGCKAIVSHGRAIEAIEALKLYRNFLKEEGKNCLTKRVDIRALDRLKMEIKSWDESRKPILGSIPGVEVGAEFHYRVELSIVGLHLHFQAGIEYIEKNGKLIATSIVASGGYDNVMDGPDVLVYCGQGGKNRDKLPKDQKLERGNLALKNSIDEKNVVRVILGSKEVENSNSMNAWGKIVPNYVYNGLYLVEKYWQHTGSEGASIFKFRLRRLSDQPNLHLGRNSKKLWFFQ